MEKLCHDHLGTNEGENNSEAGPQINKSIDQARQQEVKRTQTENRADI